jgi:hypothetical protein
MLPNPTSQPALLDREPGAFAFYLWQNVLIVCWSQRATGPAVDRLVRVRASIDGDHPEGVSVVYLIRDGAGLPTPEARTAVREMMDQYRERRACLAVVLKGQGFWFSAISAAITGVRMLVPGQFPMLVCAEVEEVVAWLPVPHAARTGRRLPPAELRNVLQELCAAL